MAVYRDERGVEYVSVPLPTHEVTDAVPLDARIKSKRAAPKHVPFYAGTDGARLARQPRSHRRQWTDAQWLAYREQVQLESEMAQDDAPVAAVVLIKE